MMMNNLSSFNPELLQKSLRQCSLQSTEEAFCAVSAYAAAKPAKPLSFAGLGSKYTWKEAQESLLMIAVYHRNELAPCVSKQEAKTFLDIADTLEYIAIALEKYSDGYLPKKHGNYLLEVGSMMVNVAREIRKESPDDIWVKLTDMMIEVLRWAHLLDESPRRSGDNNRKKDDSNADDKSSSHDDKKPSSDRKEDDEKTGDDVEDLINELEMQLGEQNPHFHLTPYDSHIDYWKELDKLIGMDSVKSQLQTLISDFKLQNQRKVKHPDLKVSIAFHCLYLGNPGTGKTTVARLVAGILRQEGIIAKGQYLEVGSKDLINPYVGVSPKLAELACLYCLDGLLFIDEAYALGNNKGSKSDVGAGVVDTLTQLIENYGSRLCIILAGYESDMKNFLSKTNPGFMSRFNHILHFRDYNSEEMSQIFMKNIAERYYRISDDCISVVQDFFDVLIERKHQYRGFANARTVRIFTEVVIGRASERMRQEAEMGRNVDIDLLVVDDFKLNDDEMIRVLGF